MAKLLISTQYTENYGSADEPYWKFKGGNEYFVPMDKGTMTEATMLVMAARSKIEFVNDMATEYIIDWKIVADDYMTDFERSQLEYDGRIAYPAATITI